MTDNGQPLTADLTCGTLKCEYTYQGEPKSFEVDVIDGYCLVRNILEQKEGMLDQTIEMKTWAAKQGHELQSSQAWTLLLQIIAAYDEFKKKLPQQLQSLIITSSIPASSTGMSTTHSPQTSPESSPENQSASTIPAEADSILTRSIS
jgi:hypothetical protein